MLFFFILLDLLIKQDGKSSQESSLKDHMKLSRSRRGEMESHDDAQDGYNLDMNGVPNEKLKLIVELDQNNLRVSCEGPCGVDKWRAAYASNITVIILLMLLLYICQNT